MHIGYRLAFVSRSPHLNEYTYRWGDVDGTCEICSNIRFHKIVIKLSKRIFEYAALIWPSELFQLHVVILYSRKMLTKSYRHMIFTQWKWSWFDAKVFFAYHNILVVIFLWLSSPFRLQHIFVHRVFVDANLSN